MATWYSPSGKPFGTVPQGDCVLHEGQLNLTGTVERTKGFEGSQRGRGHHKGKLSFTSGTAVQSSKMAVWYSLPQGSRMVQALKETV